MQGSLALAEAVRPVPMRHITATALQVQLYQDDAAWEELRVEWDDLLEHSAQGSFFLRWAWARLWWQTYAPPEGQLYVIACRDATGRLVGLAPLYWQQRRFFGVPHLRDLNFLGTGTGIKTSEHLDVLARRGYERVIAETVAAFLLQRRDWDRLWLWNIPEQSQVLPHLQQALGEAATSSVCDQPHFIDTDAGWENVKQDWSRKFAVNLERGLRKLQQRGLQFQRVQSAVELPTALDEFVRLHQGRWQAKGERGSFAFPKFETFLRTAAHQAFDQERLGFWTCQLNDQCVAALLAFIDRGVAHYFQSGFDMQYAKYSLGSVMVAHCIRDCVADPDIREFDFMGGNAAYKDSWTKKKRVAYELELFRQGPRALLYLSGRKTRKLLSRARRALRAHLQAPSKQARLAYFID